MKKTFALLILAAVGSLANAQTTTPRYSLTEPIRLLYQAKQPELRLASLELWNFQLSGRNSHRSSPTINLYFGSRNDPFRTWNGRRVGFREMFGAEFGNDRTNISFSTGSSSEGRMSNVGFEIRW